MSTEIQNKLLSEFPPVSYEEWRKEAESGLKGAPFDKKLLTGTYEGITLQPIYMQKDEGVPYADSFPGAAPYLRGAKASGYKAQTWDVCQSIPASSPEELNRLLLADLQCGQTAAYLALDCATRAGKDPDQGGEDVGCGGVSIATVEDLATAFANVSLEHLPVFLHADVMAIPVTALFAAFCQQHKIALNKLQGVIVFDPLGQLVRKGTLPSSLTSLYNQMAALTGWAILNAPHLQTVTVQGFPYHNSGASAVQELAFVIATAVEYLKEMHARGISVDDAAPRIRFEFSVGTQYFMEVAKLRAARVIWAKVVKAFGGNDAAQKMRMHVGTSQWNKTKYDPYVNLLRTTIEAFAGVVGGCDSLRVGAFDEPVRTPDEFSRRIARNTHIILDQESHVAETIDPAGGSWYVEKLTDDVARKAWALFQDVERRGGMAKAIEAGFPQEQIAQIAQQRIANLATRKDTLLGTNIYPNLDEKPLEKRSSDTRAFQASRAEYIRNYRKARHAFTNISISSEPAQMMSAAVQCAASGATLGELASGLPQTGGSLPKVTPLNVHRGAEMFETLREASEAYAVKTGNPPQIFLANMGQIPQHKARADFSIGFFQVGGFNMLNNDGFPTVDAAAKAALDSGASMVVICSTDDTYPEIVPPLTKAIKAAKPETLVIVAGYPKDHIEAFKQAGVDEFIHIRANLYETLVTLMKKLGILS